MKGVGRNHNSSSPFHLPNWSFWEKERGQQQTGALSEMRTIVPTRSEACSKAHKTRLESFIHVVGIVVVV